MSWDKRQWFKIAISTLFIGAFTILFAPFYAELLLAGILALAMEPFLGRWLQPRHLRWKTSVALILVGMFTLVAFPINWLAYRTYKYALKISQQGLQESELFRRLSEFKTRLSEKIDGVFSTFGIEDRFDLSGLMDEGLQRGMNFLVQFSTQVASQIPQILLSIFVFCAALYFFLAESRGIKSQLIRQRLLNHWETDRLIGLLQKSCSAIVITSVIIAFVQASIVAIGALILKGGDPVVVWVLTFIFSFIPVIGAGPVALVLAIFKLVMGDVGPAIGFVVVAVIAGTMDNLLRPYLISGDDLNPVVGLLAIIGAILVFGMPGLFLGPVIATVAIRIVPALWEPEPTAIGKNPSKKEP